MSRCIHGHHVKDLGCPFGCGRGYHVYRPFGEEPPPDGQDTRRLDAQAELQAAYAIDFPEAEPSDEAVDALLLHRQGFDFYGQHPGGEE